MCQLERCLCAHVPRVASATPILIVRHHAERSKPTNSGRLAALALPLVRIVDVGGPEEQAGLLHAVLPGAALLFPGPNVGPAARPTQLVVVDGTWQQARRISQKRPELRVLPRMSLPAPDQTRSRLRLGHRPDAMATLEAIATALKLLEGEDIGAPLLRLYDHFVATLAAPLIRTAR
jgi:DTW domain-containing protein YfiP